MVCRVRSSCGSQPLGRHLDRETNKKLDFRISFLHRVCTTDCCLFGRHPRVREFLISSHFNSGSSQIGFAHLIIFVPALFALILGFRRARSMGVEPKQTVLPVLDAPQQSNGALRLIRSKLPVPILYALVGVTVFGLLDATTGRFFGQFISDRSVAVVLSALAGAAMGYSLGWHIVSTNGLPPNTTPYEMNAALRKRARNGRSSLG